MDPLSHAVVGRAVTALLDEGGRFGPGVGAAAILGALSPDVDVILVSAGWDIYLAAHQIGTHTMLGALATASGSAALVHRLTRGSRYLPLAAAASAGALSHLVLDALSGARIRFAWPVVEAGITLPLVAMADPWLLAIFVAGGLGLWAGRKRMRLVACLLLSVAVAFLSLKFVLLERAMRSSNLRGTSTQAIEAQWGSLTAWHVFDRTPRALRAWRVDSRGGPATPVLLWTLEPETPLANASRSLDTVRNFLRAHDFGFATEESEGGNRTGVFWSDIRFCRRADPREGPIACSLWFGGIFGPDGRILTQEIKLGGWVQTRAAPR